MIHAMYLNMIFSKKFAGKVVASMIHLGCDPEIMRIYGIPTLVFYGVLGGNKHLSKRSPEEVAKEEVKMYRIDTLTR